MTRSARLVLDAGIFVAFAIALFPSATGISVHEWLSLAIVAPALAHVILNWEWVLASVQRLFGKMRAASKLNLVVDSLLFVTTVAVMLSGLLISRTVSSALGVASSGGAIWNAVHAASAYATFALASAHLLLHWSWLLVTIRTAIGTREAAA